MSNVPLTLEDEEFLEALSTIDSEKIKNIIVGYLENIKKNHEDALRKYKKGNLDLEPSKSEYIDLNCCKCKKLPYISITINTYNKETNKIYCPDCWFKECFGVLETQDSLDNAGVIQKKNASPVNLLCKCNSYLQLNEMQGSSNGKTLGGSGKEHYISSNAGSSPASCKKELFKPLFKVTLNDNKFLVVKNNKKEVDNK